MRKYLLVLMVALSLVLVVAAREQRFDASSEGYGFSSEEYSSGSSYLGVDTRDITADRISALKLKDESGVEVTMVDQDAPAGKAGIKEHDVILTMNGTKVESVEQLRRMIRETPSGRLITLGISRDGLPISIQVMLAARRAKGFNFKMPNMPDMPHITMPRMPDIDVPVNVVIVHSAMRSGLMVENLTPQLGDFFGAKNGQGVLVRSVEKGSRAEKAGFRAGDVIVRVDKDPVHDTSDFSHALQSHRSGGPVSVGVIRDKREQTLTLTLPERKQSGDIFNEESFEFPDVDIDADLDFDHLYSDLALLRPDFQFAAGDVRRNAEEFRKKMREQQKEFHKEQRRFQKQMRDQGQRLREEMKKHGLELERGLREFDWGTAEI